MEANKDVRILTLQKQHYFKNYDKEMICDYSCWGYYDGISVAEAPAGQNELFEKRSDAPVSQLWYGSGESIGKLNGNYSRQNIGIFRSFKNVNDKERAEKFWETYKKNPYAAVCFIKLTNAALYREIRGVLEKELFYQEKNIYVKTLIYYTFDNADLVMITLSNSMTKLEDVLKCTEGKSEIQYMYSVMGVNESFLKYCSKEIAEVWQGQTCCTDEKIGKIVLQVAASGKKDTLEILSCQLREEIGKYRQKKTIPQILGMYASGQQTAVLEIQGLYVKEFLSFFITENGGILTHANPLFGTEIYNIETEIHIVPDVLDNYSSVPRNAAPVQAGMKTEEEEKWMWGEILVEKYRKQMEEAFEIHDESMYSYYKAMIQTANTLTQYEGFPMARDMFYLLFPAFDMFDRHLDSALEKVKESQLSYKMTEIKQSICDFINAVNSIIYHTVHTDQVFLMIPGYSGTSFSIPIKLCLAYLWLANEVIEFLNDKKYEYNCFITPEMESCPVTTLIDMGMPGHDRLICFCSSQRSLYMPRHFMMILTHEIAHYVGTAIRERKKRASGIIITLAYFLAEGVFPEEDLDFLGKDSEERKVLGLIYENNKKRAQERAVDYLRNKIKNQNNQYHATEITRPLEEGCLEFLSDGNDGICSDIFYVAENVTAMFDGERTYEKAERLYEVQKKLNANRISLQTSGVMENIIRELILLYREVFSDIAAISILKCDEKTFKEAYDVSEGNKGGRSLQQKVRDDIAANIFWKQESTKQKQLRKESGEESVKSVMTRGGDCERNRGPKKLFENMYSYIWVRDELLSYAESSYAAIEERLHKIGPQRLKKVRDFYEMFNGTLGERSSDDIYEYMMGCIQEYNYVTDEKYIARLKSSSSSE